MCVVFHYQRDAIEQMRFQIRFVSAGYVNRVRNPLDKDFERILLQTPRPIEYSELMIVFAVKTDARKNVIAPALLQCVPAMELSGSAAVGHGEGGGGRPLGMISLFNSVLGDFLCGVATLSPFERNRGTATPPASHGASPAG